jgi:hypothetical protein
MPPGATILAPKANKPRRGASFAKVAGGPCTRRDSRWRRKYFTYPATIIVDRGILEAQVFAKS